ncbi:hypothetical protein MTO96_001776 [Rhipicephalus appendiculatus]
MVTLHGAIRMVDTVDTVDTVDMIRVLALHTAATPATMATTIPVATVGATVVATVAATVVATPIPTFGLQLVPQLELLLQRHSKKSWSTRSRNTEVLKSVRDANQQEIAPQNAENKYKFSVNLHF